MTKENGVLLATPKVTTYSYNAVGNLRETILPNGVRTIYEYDTLNLLQSERLTDASGTLLAYYSYTTLANGYFGGATEQVRQDDGSYVTRQVVYAYDSLDRLIGEEQTAGLPGTNYVISWLFDLAGNRLQETTTRANGDVDQTISTYNQRDQLLQSTTLHNGVVSLEVSFAYDPNGSLISKLGSDGSAAGYRYDLHNRLAGAVLQKIENGQLITRETAYAYNPNNIRVREEVTTTIDAGPPTTESTRLLIDGRNPTGFAQVLEERNSAGILQASFVHGWLPISQFRNGSVSYYLLDGHSGVRLLTDALGNVTDRYTFDAFGNLLQQSGATVNPLLYRGEQFDPVLGQYYLRARFYDPATGRFSSADPFFGNLTNPISSHDYLYGNDNPVNMADPSGSVAMLLSLLNLLGLAALSGARMGAISFISEKVGRAPDAVAFGFFWVPGREIPGARFQYKNALAGIEWVISPRLKKQGFVGFVGGEAFGTLHPAEHGGPIDPKTWVEWYKTLGHEFGVFESWLWGVHDLEASWEPNWFGFAGFQLPIGGIFIAAETEGRIIAPPSEGGLLYGASITLQPKLGWEVWGAGGLSWTIAAGGDLTKDQTVGYVLTGEGIFSSLFSSIVFFNLSSWTAPLSFLP